MKKTVAFLVFEDFNILDLTGPLAAFDAANRAAFQPVYRLKVISENGGVVRSSSGLEVVTGALIAGKIDTLIVVGGEGGKRAADSLKILQIVQKAARKSRLASVCTGAFILAAAGVLDGKRITTHWKRAISLQRSYPGIKVEADEIFIKDGSVWSSAGTSAGIDLALAILEEDFDEAFAKSVAGDLVVYYRRPGGQGQFSTMHHVNPSSYRIKKALQYCSEHLKEELSVERIAQAVNLSVRQFTRLFRAETGLTPAKAVEKIRTEAARSAVENASIGLEQVAHEFGFADPERMRRAFIRSFGHPPQSIRRQVKEKTDGLPTR